MSPTSRPLTFPVTSPERTTAGTWRSSETYVRLAIVCAPAHTNQSQNFRVQFHRNEQFESQFSLVGVDAAIANAFRRILIAELPTLAIEDVYILKNTSIIQDEVLSHRLGLIPLKGSPEAIRNMTWYKKSESGEAEQGAHTDYNTVVLELNVQCEWHPDGRDLAKKGETDPKKLFINSSGTLSRVRINIPC